MGHIVRSAFNYDRSMRSALTAHVAVGEIEVEDRTKQSMAEECDINTIVKRFGLTQQMPVTFKPPMSGDFTGVTDFQSALNAVMSAEKAFMEMPAVLRERFHHNPQELLAFLDDVKNKDEAIKLGLIPKPAERTRDVVTAIDELAAKMVSRETK